MSGEWIKIEITLPNKPEVIRIGRALGLSPEAVCGYLIRFWGWASSNSVDGFVTQLALRDIDMIVTLPGFADAIVAVGWLRQEPDTDRLALPNFDRHNGESAKKRGLTAKRQERYRNANSNAVVTQQPLPEKRREEKNKSIEGTRASRGTRLQVEELPESWKVFCITRRSDLNPESVFEQFKDYWVAIPGSKGVKLDWAGTWRNWVRRQDTLKGGNWSDPAPAACARCHGSLIAGHTKRRDGLVCNECEQK